MEDIVTKKCSSCGIEKNADCFYNRSKIKRHLQCKSCMDEISRKSKLSLGDDFLKRQRIYSKTWAKKRRKKIIEHYGGECQCCGEKTDEFLCIDHINGNGNKHRKNIGIGSGSSFYNYLVKNSLPNGYRVLCHNCNMAYGHYGYCPHQKVNQ